VDESVVFPLVQRDARLIFAGAPSGTEVRIDGQSAGRTGGAPLLVKPGQHLVQVGTWQRNIPFGADQTVTLNWSEIAPTTIITKQPTEGERERAAWSALQNSSDIQALRGFLDSFPRGEYARQAEARLENAVWAGTNQNDAASLGRYLSAYPSGPHAQQAHEGIWNKVDQKSQQQLKAFVSAHPTNPRVADANRILGEFEITARKGEEDRLRKEKQDAALKEQTQPLLDVISQINAAVQTRNTQNTRLLERLWVPFPYKEQMSLPLARFSISFAPRGNAIIEGDKATMACTWQIQSEVRNKRQDNVGSGTLKFQKRREGWVLTEFFIQ
jgi:hypothetical protein